MNLSRYEQEAIVIFNEADSTAEIFTYNGRMKRTLAKLAADRPAEVQHIRANPEGGETYTLPKGWIKVRAPRIMSDAQRNALQAAQQKANLSRKTTAHA